MTENSINRYRDFFIKNQIPFEEDLVSNGIKIKFYLPQINVAYYNVLDNRPKEKEKIKARLYSDGYIPRVLNETKKGLEKAHLGGSEKQLRGEKECQNFQLHPKPNKPKKKKIGNGSKVVEFATLAKKPKKKKIGNGSKVAEFATTMTNEPTPAEKAYRDYLLARDIFFETQVPIKGKTQWWIADFVLKNKIVIEIDGGYHLSKVQRARDKMKDEELAELGYTVYRITNDDVFNNLNKIGFCAS